MKPSWGRRSAPTSDRARWASSSIRSRSAVRDAVVNLDDVPVTAVPGVGPARAAALRRMGVDTVGALLRRPPKDYVDARRPTRVLRLTAGRPAAVAGTVVSSGWRRSRRDPGLWTGVAELRDDDGGKLRLLWFRRTAPGRRPPPLPTSAVGGRVTATGSPRFHDDDGWHMIGPDVEPKGKASLHTGRIVPVYSLTEGLSQKLMRRVVRAALDEFALRAEDSTPGRVWRDGGLPSLAVALEQLHFPDDFETLHRARQRLALDELLLLRLLVATDSGRKTAPAGRALPPVEPGFLRRLPFPLTAAQRRAVADIDADLSRARPMRRLLQGDVGSGKTVVAAYALARAAAAGGQAVLVAPSDALARQHAATLTPWFAPDGVDVALLRGATDAGARRALLARLAAGEPLVVVGTHAVWQEGVRFPRLDVVVVDEQHRFGVAQRRKLLRSPRPPHVLVVSATPIPRTLAHLVYGDLDVTLLKEGPAGRQPVDTRWVRPARRNEVYRFVRSRVAEGEQAFVVFPAIGGSEGDEGDPGGPGEDGERLLPAARVLTAGPLANLRAEIVHGRQSPAEQAAALDRFRRGGADVLLATTVVEVGIDVPRASVIVIEGADKFGLAQLHQLRGRVGRGGGPAWCFLVAEPRTAAARERLRALREIRDGFALAERDMILRGPGELLGLRQSGVPDLSPLGRAADEKTVALAQKWAARLLTPRAGTRPEDEDPLWRRVERRRKAVLEESGV